MTSKVNQLILSRGFDLRIDTPAYVDAKGRLFESIFRERDVAAFSKMQQHPELWSDALHEDLRYYRPSYVFRRWWAWIPYVSNLSAKERCLWDNWSGKKEDGFEYPNGDKITYGHYDEAYGNFLDDCYEDLLTTEEKTDLKNLQANLRSTPYLMTHFYRVAKSLSAEECFRLEKELTIYKNYFSPDILETLT